MSLALMIAVPPSVALGDTLIPNGTSSSQAGTPPNGRSFSLSGQIDFEANQGQHHSAARFLARAPGYNVFLTEAGATFTFHANSEKAGGASQSLPPMALKFENASAAVRLSAEEQSAHQTNYILGDSKATSFTNIPSFKKVRYQGIYPGIDIVFYGKNGQVEYDFILQPGADPGKIEYGFSGADRIELSPNGDLLLGTAAGSLTQHKPVVYQSIAGKLVPVAAEYQLTAGNRVKFKLANYDRAQLLTIDPILSYSSYLGGASGDFATAIAVDAAGSAYVTGFTQSANFPVAGAYQSTRAGTIDVFVAKLNASGTALVYATYIGGRSSDSRAYGIAVDQSGNAYVAGWTSSNTFPVTAGAYSSAISGGGGFITKLNAAGNTLGYSTYLKTAIPAGVRVNAAGEAFVAGYTTGGLPVTAGAYQPVIRAAGVQSGFVTKMNAAGSGLVYSTYLGSSGTTYIKGLAVDGSGNAYLAGSTRGGDFPVTAAFQPAMNGSGDAIVAKLNPTGTALLYSTFLGGAALESANAIDVDRTGRMFVAGDTYSVDFPVTSGMKPYPATSFNNGFITIIGANGSSLMFSEYLGGKNCLSSTVTNCAPFDPSDVATSIAVEPGGRHVTVAGFFGSVEVEGLREALQTARRGYRDAFIAKYGFNEFSPSRPYLLEYMTRFGGDDNDQANGIALDREGNAYVVGDSVAGTSFPTTGGAFKVATAGMQESFVAKLTTNGLPLRLDGICGSYEAPGTVNLAVHSLANASGDVSILQGDQVIASVTLAEGYASYSKPLPPGAYKFSARRESDGMLSRPIYCEFRP
jgi:hypothetical protein